MVRDYGYACIQLIMGSISICLNFACIFVVVFSKDCILFKYSFQTYNIKLILKFTQ